MWTDYDLSATGMYSILVTEFSNDHTVQYALALACSAADVCPPPISLPDISGCIFRQSTPLVDIPVNLDQPGQPTQTTSTDIRGCYAFESIVTAAFEVTINGPGDGFDGCPDGDVDGDLDGDCDVDRDDIAIILAARNTAAIGPDDPRDRDGDGVITGLDARRLTLLCTRPLCATD